MLKILLGSAMMGIGSGLVWFGGNFARDGWISFTNSGVPNALLETNVDLDRTMHILNRGRDVKDIEIFATKYFLDGESFGKAEVKLDQYSRIGGSIAQVGKLKHDRSKSIILDEIQMLEFADNPEEELNGMQNNKLPAVLIYYGIRVTYVSIYDNKRHISYHVIGSYKNYPNTHENPETTASAGPVDSPYEMGREISKLIIQHQKEMYMDQ